MTGRVSAANASALGYVLRRHSPRDSVNPDTPGHSGYRAASLLVAVTSATITATAAKVSFHHRFRFVNRQGAAVKLRPIQLGDRFVGVFLRHRDKTKTLR
jgi:hypothetical protein